MFWLGFGVGVSLMLVLIGVGYLVSKERGAVD